MSWDGQFSERVAENKHFLVQSSATCCGRVCRVDFDRSAFQTRVYDHCASSAIKSKSNYIIIQYISLSSSTLQSLVLRVIMTMMIVKKKIITSPGVH